ncbi:Helitron helicase [Phytophthora megakarya]|uniref:Helitron helicase n=1 Tax=Phytophthora megakarya TaxID=4795 RepID=A0A225UH13_9STRA|nr:Helitron helicase [Phytophthora megakarya]
MMNRDFFEAVDRVVRDIIKNESEPRYTRGDDSCALLELRSVRKITSSSSYRKYAHSGSAADLAKFSNFLLQIGEGRYPVNGDIGQGDIYLPDDMYVFPDPLEVPPVLGEPRDEAADSDNDEDDETEPFPIYNLHPTVDDHNLRDLELIVHDAAPDSDNVPPRER